MSDRPQVPVNDPPPDADERRRIEEDLDNTLFVEAGAGSGKTDSMVRRIIALFATGRVEPRGLAAITFTRKAAAELRQRLQVRLEEALRQESDPARRQRLSAAAAHLGEAFVGTIHSFCGRLLREHPFEAGLDPEFTELAETEAERFREESWQEYLARLQADRPDLMALMDDLGATAHDLHQVYQQLARYPDVEPVRADVPRPDFQPAREALVAFVRALRKRFPSARPERGWDKLQSAVLRVEGLLSLGGPGADRRVTQAYEALEADPDGSIVLNRWADPNAGREARDLFRAFHREQLTPFLRAWREHCHGRLLDLVRPAVAFAARRRREQARLDYEDLLLGAARLLREHPGVRRRLARRFTHILVDEFQDTDPVQAEVMFLLTGTPEDEADWRRLRPRPGSLFVVGDPKQSIYRFRRADIATYQEVRDLIVKAGGAVVRLTANFRSLPAVAGWVTGAFGNILPTDSTPYQAAFAPLLPVRPEETGAGAGVRRLTVPASIPNKKEEIARADAARIAAWIAWACAGNLRLARAPGEPAAGLPPTAQPGDFLVLVPYTHRLGLYAAALEAAGLPVEVSGAASLAASRHVRSLLQVLQAVADPADQVKLLACLRGPCFGISDADLYRFRAAGGRFSVLSVEDQPAGPVSEALAWLNRYWLWSRRLPAVVAVERIIEDLGLLPYAAGGPNGGSEAGTLIAALEILRAADDAEVDTFVHAVALLAAVVEESEQDTESLVPSTANAVRVMNLHKAKGLEAPVVFLADPTRRVDYTPKVHVDRRVARPQGYFLFRGAPDGPFGQGKIIGQPPNWDAAAAEEEHFAAAERDRLLYVAATRARNLLVVSRYEGRPDADPWARLAPALEAVPELEEADPPAVSRPVLAVAGDAAEADVARAATAVAAAAAPGYRALTVTDLTKGEPRLPAVEGGKGASWGEAVHRLLAAVAQGLERERWHPLAGAILAVLAEGGRDPAEADELVRLVSSVWDSQFGERVRRASRVLCEVPFGQALPAAALGLAGDGGPDRALLEGVIDLAFREEDGWVIADYKTDAAAASYPAELAAHHAPQVRQYVRFWREALGEPVKEALLVFTSPLHVVGVPPIEAGESVPVPGRVAG